MWCKDCCFFKQWRPLSVAMCEKFHKQIEPSARPCDQFISKQQKTNEWGEQTCDFLKDCR